MPVDQQAFRSSLQFDGARPNLFEIQLTFPPVVGTGGTAPGTLGGAMQALTFRARATALPGDTIPMIEVPYFGRTIKIPATHTFAEWKFTVVEDENFIIRTAFERWMSGINSHVGNLRLPEFIRQDGGYAQDGLVTQFGKVGDPIKQYKMVGSWPVDLSPIEVAWDANDALDEYTVTMALQWWETPDSTDATTSMANYQIF
jgi:hypothetical protein